MLLKRKRDYNFSHSALMHILCLCVIALLPVTQTSAAVHRVAKVQKEYHEMCGCNYVYWLNHFEGGVDEPSFTFATQDNDAYGGTPKSNKLLPSTANTFCSLQFPACIVSDFMRGNSSRMTGYFKTNKSSYCNAYAEYTLSNGTKVKMEQIRLVGSGGWKKFEYHLDFSDLTTIASVTFYMNTPTSGAATVLPLFVDELSLCKFCSGSNDVTAPQLSSLKVFTAGTSTEIGEFSPVFNPANGRYTITMPPNVVSVQVQPTLDANPAYAGTILTVNGVAVTSGQKSSAISLNYANADNHSLVTTLLTLPVTGGCNRTTFYTLEFVPVQTQVVDATLYDLQLVKAEQYLTPAFYRYTTAYDVYVGYSLTDITLIPTATDPAATIKVNGFAVSTGGEAIFQNVTTGTVLPIVVTAKDKTTTKTYTITVKKNDSKIAFASATGSGSESTTSPTISVTVSPAPVTGLNLSVNYAVTGGTAIGNGVDYTLDNGILTFDAAHTSQKIPLKVVNDAVGESNETIIITLSGAQLGTNKVFTYTINDDDNAEIRYVRANIGTSGNGRSWSTAYKYLQDALTEARTTGSGINTIRIAKGTYYPDEKSATPNGSDDKTLAFILVNGVALIGGYPENGGDSRNSNPETNGVVLNGNIDHEDGENTLNGNSYNVVTGAGVTSTLDGITITGGNATSADPYSFNWGGGVYADNCNLSFNNCQILDNQAFWHGGGIYCSGTIAIESSIIRGNYAGNNTNNGGSGGGIYCHLGNVRLFATSFLHNRSDYGAGSYFYGSNKVEINTCLYNQNVATSRGGAVFLNCPCSTKVSNTTFFNNSSTVNGGAINIDEAGTTQIIEINKCTFDGNRSQNGGALYFNGPRKSCPKTILNTVFYLNEATINGGAISLDRFMNKTFFDIINCSFSHNTAIMGGGAIYTKNNASDFTIAYIDVNIRNSIFWFNNSNSGGKDFNCDGNTVVNHTYCDIQYPDASGLHVTDISLDPKFVNNASTAELNLLRDSPCINAAGPDAPFDDRIFNQRTIPDIGAYEYVP